MRILLLGDVHWKISPYSPFNLGLEKLFKWLLDVYSDCILILTGDFFDTPSIHWRVYEKAASLLKGFSHVYIVTGNHDFNWIKGNSLKPLALQNNITIIDRQLDLKISEYNVAFFPFLSRIEEMKEKYPLYNKQQDFSVSHVSPPGLNYGGADEIEFKFKANLSHIYGHIHEKSQFENEFGVHDVIGVPQTTRNLEQRTEKQFIMIDQGKISYNKVHTFFDIEDVIYGKEPSSKDNLINIVDAPSVSLAMDKYKDFYLRKEGIKLLRTSDTDNSIFSLEDMKELFSESLLLKFQNYCKDNEVEDELKICLKNYLTAIV